LIDLRVAVCTKRGIVVPVLRDADQKSFAQIERDLVAYAVKTRDGKIALEGLRGGGFTTSNRRIYGSLLWTPILNPPQRGGLSMYRIKKHPVAGWRHRTDGRSNWRMSGRNGAASVRRTCGAGNGRCASSGWRRVWRSWSRHSVQVTCQPG
jgi:hypothetical protein